MAYQARHEDDYDAGRSYSEQTKIEDQRKTENNANTLRNAADVAIASKNPYAVAIGAGVKAADKLTGGKSTDALGKAFTKANKHGLGGKALQKASDKLAESGMGDKIGDAARIKNMADGGGEGAANGADKAADAAKKAQDAKNAEAAAHNAKKLDEAASRMNAAAANNSDKKGGERDGSPSSDEDEKKGGLGKFLVRQMVITMVLTFAPVLLLILIVILVAAMVTGVIGNYEDAFGMSSTLEEETGDMYFTASSKEQEKFYKRIYDIKLDYEKDGKSFDAMKIVAIFAVLRANDANIDYDKVSNSTIKSWANSMLKDGFYDEETFKDNLIHDILPHYLKHKSDEDYKILADEVIAYVNDYNDLIGKNANGGNCASIGSCSYNIKGFYLGGRGNVVKNMQVSDLKVRLMECGSPYGNGSYNKAIDQDLVSFEDYVAGVAYAEVGPNAPEEVLKAQMVAARSFALARPTAMNNSNGKKLVQENGQWILQISSCVADQVFCNVDQGCSYMGGGDGQGGIVKSGKVSGAKRTRDPLPQNHPLRAAAAETQGEVLVNAQGYIINTSYKSTDQKNWESLAKSGLNYKQILLQSYNSSAHNMGAADIQRASCSSGENANCISTGEFSKWKQTDPQWRGVPMGNSGKNLGQIGCLVTSISMQIAKSGVKTQVSPFNPGTFVQYLNTHGGFAAGGNFLWYSAQKFAPEFKYQQRVSLSGLSREAKLNKIKSIVSQKGVYAVCEVKGPTGQHWVAIDSVTGDTINMMDPSSKYTNMWQKYFWGNTSAIVYYKVG